MRLPAAVALASAAIALALAVCPGAGAVPASALSSQQRGYLSIAEQGIAQAQQFWGDSAHPLYDPRIHRNAIPYHWYDETLACHSSAARRTAACKYPLATIWGLIPLWESVDAVAIADPSAANRKAVARFARNARAYWDRRMTGYAPYPGDRGVVNTWFDDNSWWGLGFLDAYRAIHSCLYVRWAQQAFDFVAKRGWAAAAGGGFWWNSDHTPAGQRAGEPLAAVSLLGALLAQVYSTGACKPPGAHTAANAHGAANAHRAANAHGAANGHRAANAHGAANGHRAANAQGLAAADERAVEQYLAWGDQHFSSQDQYRGLYWRTADDPTPTPYITAPTVEAKAVLCQLLGASSVYCAQASQLAATAMARFEDRLNMGPQYDAIYLHWMLVYGRQVGDPQWVALAREMAANALANARDSSGLFQRGWDGSDMARHQAGPGMLRTHAATVELFAWLAVDGP